MLWAIGQPAAFAGLLGAFLIGLGLRAVAVRVAARALGLAAAPVPVRPRLPGDVDPFGAVGAALGGTGWGRSLDVDQVPRFRGRGARAAVFAAGPLAVFAAAQLALAGYATAYPADRFALLLNRPSDVLRGAVAPTAGAQLMISVAVGLLCFALLALIPLPPLDGFGLLWCALRAPGETAHRAKRWLADNNVGIAVLLVLLLVPLGRPLLYLPIDAIGTPLMRMWA